jgi:hypothetical protein
MSLQVVVVLQSGRKMMDRLGSDLFPKQKQYKTGRFLQVTNQ